MAPESEPIGSVGNDELDRLPDLIDTLQAEGGRVAIRQGSEVVAVVVPSGLLDQFDRLARSGNAALDRIGSVFDDADPEELDREALRAVAEVRAESKRDRSSG